VSEVIYGRWAVLEMLRAGRRSVSQVLLADTVEEKSIITELNAAAEQRQVAVKKVPRRMLEDVARSSNHQGVAARVGQYPYAELDEVLAHAASKAEKPFLLILDLLQDPQNVGTLLRTADAVGIHGVIIQDRRGVAITPAVVNASSGAAEHLRVVQVNNIVNAMRKLKESGVWLVGFDIGPDLLPIDRADLAIPLGLVMGAEGEGMRRLVRETCDMLLTLPMRGRVGSLNVATVGAVALYSAWQAREWQGWAAGKNA
jgi:23S rRNA (guanosine2251-2'-O)-methyltransferase